MIDHNRTKTPKGTLPDFTPVPRHYKRHDGWTPDRQRRFIEALADLGSVRAAAHAVNMAPEGAYLLRRHPQGHEFRKAWEAALACGVQRLEDVAMDRALHGVEVPVYHFGEVVGTRRVYNDALLMFLLRNRAPRRFAADSLHAPDAIGAARLDRLKRQWRDEWEAERRAEMAAEDAEVLESIDRQLDQMRERHRALMSPEELRLDAQLRDAERRRRALPPPSEDGDQDESGHEDHGG